MILVGASVLVWAYRYQRSPFREAAAMPEGEVIFLGKKSAKSARKNK
jgi:hypothetical protein